MNIHSPIATGNGAYVVHNTLDRNISNYQIHGHNPFLTLFPPALHLVRPRTNKGDIIHTVPDYASFFAKRDSPLVVTFHNYVLDEFMRPYSTSLQYLHYQTDLKFFIMKALRLANRVTAVSQFTASIVKNELQYPNSIDVIENGVDATMFSPANTRSNDKNVNVLFCGNLTQRKGVQWLHNVANLLDDRIMIHYTKGLRTRRDVAPHPRLNCIGSVQYGKMPELYNSMDILFMPTVREGLSLAVLEAMACALPVVATDCSSMPELIDEGKGGYLCSIGDVEGFANRIGLLADCVKKRSQMGDYNREKIERSFLVEQMVEKYKSLFNECG